jgi:hypothetical protein
MSALSMTIMAVVMAFSLTAWLGLVFLADRQPRGKTGAQAEIKNRQAEERLPAKRGDIAA